MFIHISFQLNDCALSHKFSLLSQYKSFRFKFLCFVTSIYSDWVVLHCISYCVDYFYYMFKNLFYLFIYLCIFQSGVDVNKPNSYDQTALDIVRSFTTCHAEREMKHLLKGKISILGF